jgi:hypothetical protein
MKIRVNVRSLISEYGKRRHIILYSGAILLIILNAANFFSYPLYPFMDPDVSGYLTPALRFLEGQSFELEHARSFPYPLFLWSVLKIFGTLKAIPIIQYIIFLAAAGLFYHQWLKWSAAQKSKQAVLLNDLIGLVLWAYLLFATVLMEFHFSIRPESMFVSFSILLCSYLLLAVRKWSYLSDKRFPIFPTLFISFLNLLMIIFFQKWILGGIAFQFILWGFIFKERPYHGSIIWISALLAPVLFLIIVLLPHRYLVRNTAPDYDLFSKKQFFYTHIPLLLDQLKTDPLFENAWGERFLLITDSILAESEGHGFPILGFCPDPIMYGEAQEILELKLLDGDLHAQGLFFDKYQRATILNASGSYLKKVWKQFFSLVNLNPYNRVYLFPREKPLSLDFYYALSVASINDNMGGGYNVFLYRYLKGVKDVPRTHLFLNLGSLFFIPYLFKVSLLLSLFGLIALSLLRKRKCVQIPISEVKVAVLSIAFILCALYLFGLAPVMLAHTLDNDRYFESFTVFPICLLMVLSSYITSLAYVWALSPASREAKHSP